MLRSLKRRLTPFNQDNAEGVLRYTFIMMKQLRADGFTGTGTTALELGTGWEPQIPLLLNLAGCDKVLSVDLHRLLDFTSCRRTVDFFKTKREHIIETLGVKASSFDRYIDGLSFSGLESFLESASITYLAPCDARKLPLPAESVDLVISNNVLEHIPPETITELFREFHRVLKTKGKMVHTIDNADHWSYSDRTISQGNFLRYEESAWQRLQKNPIDYQNRLRHFEYCRLILGCGFSLFHDLSVVDEALCAALKTIPVCSKYGDVPPEQLAISLSRIIAEKEP